MTTETAICKFCKEEVKKNAIVCKHCKKKIGISPSQLMAPVIIILAPVIILCTMLMLMIGAGSMSASSESDNSKLTDIQELSNFHKQLITLINPLDNVKKDFTNSVNKALKNGDMYSLYDEAKNLHNLAQSTSYQVTTSLKVPDFKNTQAQTYTQNAYDALGDYCIAVMMESQSIMDMANSDGSPASIIDGKDELQSAAVNMQESSIKIATNIAQAYESLGYDINQVDIVNGGLLPNKNQPSPSSDTSAS
jgi:hypothetical protein